MAIDGELNLFTSDPTLLERSADHEYARAADLLLSLASPARLKLLHALTVGETTAQRAAMWSGLPQRLAEQELAAMTREGITDRRDSPRGPTYLPRDGHVIVELHLALAHGREARPHPRLLAPGRRAGLIDGARRVG